MPLIHLLNWFYMNSVFDSIQFNQNLFFPRPDPLPGPPDCEEIYVQVEENVRVHCRKHPAPKARFTLLFFHGNAGNREDRLHNLAGLWQAGISVLIFDYRGYGGSTGSPSEPGLVADGLAAFDWLADQVAPAPVVLFGRSLGGAVAAAVAGRRPAKGLILESTFTSARDMAGRVLPLPGVHLIVRARYDALAAVRDLRLPLLVIHGTADEIVPFAMGRRIFESAASPAKQFRQVPGGRHNDTYLVAGDAYYGWLRELLAEAGSN